MKGVVGEGEITCCGPILVQSRAVMPVGSAGPRRQNKQQAAYFGAAAGEVGGVCVFEQVCGVPRQAEQQSR